MPLGLKRYQTEGHLHFITFSCHHRAPHLTRQYHLFEQSLEQTRQRYHLEVHGYVLMPEHVHLLLTEPATEPFAKALQALKLSVSKQTDIRPFWQPRYYDFNVFTGKKRLEKLLYMHENPVTRGLVTNPEDWPHSSAHHYLTGDPHPTIQLTSCHTSEGPESIQPPMADNIQHGPSSPDEINPKVSSDIQYWSKEFGVSGDTLHEALRVHGHKVVKIRAALAAHHHGDSAPHEKQGR